MTDEPELPFPEATGIKQALATFSLSVFLGACAVVTVTPTHCHCGATRSAHERRLDARRELEAAERSLESSPGSTPSS